ncbi:MAG: DUF4358 domain-containing protein [Clostridia bacterium]|nr:DUF4358 domain-containing protein [Clostridia bacterium]
MILILVFCFVLSASMLYGCGSSSNGEGTDKNGAQSEEKKSGDESKDEAVSDGEAADKTAADILSGLEFEDEMTKVSDDLFFGLFNLDEEKVCAVSVYESTGATAEEVVVAVAAQGCEEDLLAAMKERVESQKESFRDYVPAELDKLADPVITKKGKFTILIVCGDSSKAEKILEEI